MLIQEISVLKLTGGGVNAFMALELQTCQYASIKPGFVVWEPIYNQIGSAYTVADYNSTDSIWQPFVHFKVKSKQW